MGKAVKAPPLRLTDANRLTLVNQKLEISPPTF